MQTRRLLPEDHSHLRDFLTDHIDHAMFMLSNLERSGVIAGDEPFQGQYWGAFDADGRLQGAIALFWNGILMPCAPEGLDDLAVIAREQAHRRIQGFIGERGQVDWLVDWFGAKRFQLEAPEALYALALSDLAVPELLSRPGVDCRLATRQDMRFLVDWRAEYCHEAMNEPLTDASREAARKQMLTSIANREFFVLWHDDEPVAMSGFNASVATCVQIGGVYTPPRYRSRGYGRAVVAASLLQARARGVQRSILFTGFTNDSAQRAYEAIGYRRIGEFALKILAE